MAFMRLLLFAGVSCLIRTTLASSVNVTIDDTFGNPQTSARVVYSPANAWQEGTQACSTTGTSYPDPNRLFNGTWHESTFTPHSEGSEVDTNQIIPSASVTFNGQFDCASIDSMIDIFEYPGSAIYVYCVIPFNTSRTSVMTFFINDEVVGTFTSASSVRNESEYQYNVPVYVNRSMPAGVHKFTLQNGLKGGQRSLVMLDSIVYT